MQRLQDTWTALNLDSRAAALEAAVKGVPTSAAASPSTPMASSSGPAIKKAKGIPPAPSAPGPRPPARPRSDTSASGGRPAVGAAIRAPSVGATPSAKKVVVGGFPRQLPKAAFERYWSNDLAPALEAEFGEHGIVVSSNLGSRVLPSDGAMLGEFITIFRAGLRHWTDPRDGGCHQLLVWAYRTLAERAVGQAVALAGHAFAPRCSQEVGLTRRP